MLSEGDHLYLRDGDFFFENLGKRNKRQRSLFRADLARLKQDINFAAGLVNGSHHDYLNGVKKR
jgi:hypothetical protein